MPRRPSPTIGNSEANATSIHRVADLKVQSRTDAKDQNWQNHEERGTTGNSNCEHKHAAPGTEVEAEALEVLRLELLVCFFFFSFLFLFFTKVVILLSSQALQRPQGRDGREGYNSPTVTMNKISTTTTDTSRGREWTGDKHQGRLPATTTMTIRPQEWGKGWAEGGTRRFLLFLLFLAFFQCYSL
jgi:hypothetical protein